MPTMYLTVSATSIAQRLILSMQRIGAFITSGHSSPAWYPERFAADSKAETPLAMRFAQADLGMV